MRSPQNIFRRSPLSSGHRFTFDAICGDLVSGQQLVREMQRLGATFKAPIWQAWVDLFEGWLRFRFGDDGGVAQTRAGLAFFQGQGVGRFMPFVQSMLATAESQNDAAAGLAMIDAKIAEFRELGEHWFDAELHRAKAAILLRSNDTIAAERALRDAMSVAEKQGARMFRLRAALDLVALCDEGRREEGASLLQEALRGLDDLTVEEVSRAKAKIADCAAEPFSSARSPAQPA